jgi:hypothetical protein
MAFLKARLKAKIDTNPQALAIRSTLLRSVLTNIEAATDRRDSLI